MAKRSSRSAPENRERWFERFRQEAARYAEGVHVLGPPAPAEALEGLPRELASFLRSWDGAELFVDAVTIAPARAFVREDGLLVFGATAAGDRLALDEEGRVLKLEEDTGERLIEGTSFARWIEALMAAEAVFYDREGEFNEGVFDERREDPTPEAVARREKKALRVDPGAPGPRWRLGRALERQGRAKEARRLLEEVVSADPAFGWAWFDLGRLRRSAGDLAGAEEAFVRAAEASLEHAAWFSAHAARAAAERGDEAARARHAARAAALDPALPGAQRRAAEARLADGEMKEAGELLALVLAVAPRDLEALALKRKIED